MSAARGGGARNLTGVSPGRLLCIAKPRFPPFLRRSIKAVRAFRQALPRPLLVTTAAWSIGAYGEG